MCVRFSVNAAGESAQYGKNAAALTTRTRVRYFLCQRGKEAEERIPSRGLVHPRTSIGGGARWIQVPAIAGTQETMGGAGTKRSEVESPLRVSFPLPQNRA